MDQAHRIVEVALHQRKAGVLGSRRSLEVLFKGVVEIEEHHLTARGHHVLNLEIVQLKGIDQDSTLRLGDLLLTFALFHQNRELLGAVSDFALGDRIDLEYPFENPVGGSVQDRNGPLEGHIETVQRPSQSQGGAQGLPDRNRLRQQLPDDNVQKGKGDDRNDERNGRNRILQKLGQIRNTVERRPHQGGHEGLPEKSQRQGRDGNAQLIGGKISIEVIDHVLGSLRPPRLVFQFPIDLGGTHLDDGKLRRHEEGIQEQEEDDPCNQQQCLGQRGKLMRHICRPAGQRYQQSVHSGQSFSNTP